MKYTGTMDEQCIELCDAINRIPGLRTVESCCGHGKDNFRIWFKANKLRKLPILLYYTDCCHMGFTWHCEVKTDCGMSPVTFHLFSESMGDDAYEEAAEIAASVNKELRERGVAE